MHAIARNGVGGINNAAPGTRRLTLACGRLSSREYSLKIAYSTCPLERKKSKRSNGNNDCNDGTRFSHERKREITDQSTRVMCKCNYVWVRVSAVWICMRVFSSDSLLSRSTRNPSMNIERAWYKVRVKGHVKAVLDALEKMTEK